MHKETWHGNDFNNDGYTDFLYVGGMMFNTSPEAKKEFYETGQLCGCKPCPGPKQPPELWLGTETGKLIRSNHLIIDNRENPGL